MSDPFKLGRALRPICVTHCLHCGRRLHAPNPGELTRQMDRHARNCNAGKRASEKPRESAP